MKSSKNVIEKTRKDVAKNINQGDCVYLKNKQELVKQIEAYGLKHKLAELARKEESRRPFRHLPKQFSKGILIGNIAIVPKKYTGTRYVYVIADMLEAKILYESNQFQEASKIVNSESSECSYLGFQISVLLDDLNVLEKQLFFLQ